MAKWPNAAVCKTAIHRFKSDRRLHPDRQQRPPDIAGGFFVSGERVSARAGESHCLVPRLVAVPCSEASDADNGRIARISGEVKAGRLPLSTAGGSLTPGVPAESVRAGGSGWVSLRVAGCRPASRVGSGR